MEIKASCTRQIANLRTLEVCTAIYSTADVYEATDNPDACIDEGPENIASSTTKNLDASSRYFLWKYDCSSYFIGRSKVITAADVVDIVQNQCSDRAAVRRYALCLSEWQEP